VECHRRLRLAGQQSWPCTHEHDARVLAESLVRVSACAADQLDSGLAPAIRGEEPSFANAAGSKLGSRSLVNNGAGGRANEEVR
jgi:hypothetical protein